MAYRSVMQIEQVTIWWYMHQPAEHTPIHILPNHDDGEHFIDDNCECGAHINEDGNVVHHSFDGREAFETRERKKS